jgi:hypothetical protein
MRDAAVEKTDLIPPRNENSGNPPFDAKVRFRIYWRAVLSGDGCGKLGGAVTAAWCASRLFVASPSLSRPNSKAAAPSG